MNNGETGRAGRESIDAAGSLNRDLTLLCRRVIQFAHGWDELPTDQMIAREDELAEMARSGDLREQIITSELFKTTIFPALKRGYEIHRPYRIVPFYPAEETRDTFPGFILKATSPELDDIEVNLDDLIKEILPSDPVAAASGTEGHFRENGNKKVAAASEKLSSLESAQDELQAHKELVREAGKYLAEAGFDLNAYVSSFDDPAINTAAVLDMAAWRYEREQPLKGRLDVTMHVIDFMNEAKSRHKQLQYVMEDVKAHPSDAVQFVARKYGEDAALKLINLQAMFVSGEELSVEEARQTLIERMDGDAQ